MRGKSPGRRGQWPFQISLWHGLPALRRLAADRSRGRSRADAIAGGLRAEHVAILPGVPKRSKTADSPWPLTAPRAGSRTARGGVVHRAQRCCGSHARRPARSGLFHTILCRTRVPGTLPIGRHAGNFGAGCCFECTAALSAGYPANTLAPALTAVAAAAAVLERVTDVRPTARTSRMYTARAPVVRAFSPRVSTVRITRASAPAFSRWLRAP